MRRVFYLMGWVIAVIMQLGCEGSFSREIEVKATAFQARGVIFSILTNADKQDSVFNAVTLDGAVGRYGRGNRIYVSHSVPKEVAGESYSSANVHLQREGEAMRLNFGGQDRTEQTAHSYYEVEGKLLPGSLYHLSAEQVSDRNDQMVWRWPVVTASDRMPLPVSFLLERAYLKAAGKGKKGAFTAGYIDLKVEDEPDRVNLYKVEIVAIPGHDQPKEYVSVDIQNTRNRVETEMYGSFPTGLFEEKDFTREGRKRVYFQLNDPQDELRKGQQVVLKVRLTNFSDPYIRFMRSSRRYHANAGSPFTEPVEIYTNINNGYGVFATAARSYGEIVVE